MLERRQRAAARPRGGPGTSAAAAVTGPSYRGPSTERPPSFVPEIPVDAAPAVVPGRGHCSLARATGRSSSPPTRGGSASRSTTRLGRRVPRAPARRRHGARRRDRHGAVAVHPSLHVRPHGRRPAPLVPPTGRPSSRTRARRRAAHAARRPVLRCGSARLGSTTTATDATASRSTATASCATSTTRSSPSHAGATPPVPPPPPRRRPPHDLSPASGDLLVMGGACQRDWERARVPKVARCPGCRSPGGGCAAHGDRRWLRRHRRRGGRGGGRGERRCGGLAPSAGWAAVVARRRRRRLDHRCLGSVRRRRGRRRRGWSGCGRAPRRRRRARGATMLDVVLRTVVRVTSVPCTSTLDCFGELPSSVRPARRRPSPQRPPRP